MNGPPCRPPTDPRQIKCEWDSLYGALGAVSGEAHFAHLRGVSLEWDQSDLENLAASDPGAIHVLLRDQAGVASARRRCPAGCLRQAVSLRSDHRRDGDLRLPPQVRILDLPPYSPELNPGDQLWDIVKDETCNQVFASVGKLRERRKAPLRRSWDDAKAVLRLIGRDWFLVQRNATRRTQVSA